MSNQQTMAEPALEVIDLKKYYQVRRGLLGSTKGSVHAIDGVSFTANVGETFGIVGESGCGKSTLCRHILFLEQPNSGQVNVLGVNLKELNREELRKMRCNMQMIFQDPYSSLPPNMSIGQIISEGMTIHGIGENSEERRERGRELLSRVGLLPTLWGAAPAELSGGQRQRVVIARALAVMPKLLICDEPVSALDVSIRAQILNLLKELQAELNLTYIFVSHDLAVVRLVSTRIAVMYLGRIVELCPRDSLYSSPLHPYTLTLLLSSPVLNPTEEELDLRKQLVVGEPASLSHIPSGCRYHPRCVFAEEICTVDEPQLTEVAPGHQVACHHWHKVKEKSPSIIQAIGIAN
jgi:oligopeptide transport system ATP-binding protein